MANTPIYLNDILNLSSDDIKKTKIRFMLPSKYHNFDPNKDAEDPSKQDKLNLGDLVYNPSTRKSFTKDIIAIGFIKVDNDRWLMTGVVRVIEDLGFSRPAKAVYLNKKYNFRLVIKYHKKTQSGIYLAWKNDFINTLEVVEIWNPDKSLSDNSFPGYKNVTLSYNDLKNRIDNSAEWRTALRQRRGVYLITDKATGKTYVGSAYGIDGILGRWKTYLNSGYDRYEKENGKYPNKKFQELVKKEGMDYIKKNFQYSILETFTEDVSDEYIISRESWWKKALLCSLFGYNSN